VDAALPSDLQHDHNLFSQMVTIKNEKEIGIMRLGRQVMGDIFQEAKSFLVPGVTPFDLDIKIEKLCADFKVIPAFKGYMDFPACICSSKNDVVVHGIPDKTPLKDGDIIGIDFGIIKEELYLDSAYTFVIGEITETTQKLLKVTREACLAGIYQAKSGNTVQDISRAIENVITPFNYGIVKGYVGHGIGYNLHEDPQIPNYDTGQTGMTLKKGMTIAIEPMVNAGGEAVFVDQDKWAVRTKDKSLSAHYEHTLLITDDKPEILTQWPS
jgi:methionyl aminopeptidase